MKQLILLPLVAILLCVHTSVVHAQIPCPKGASKTSNNFCLYIEWTGQISQTLLQSTLVLYVPGVNGNKTNVYAFQQYGTSANIAVFKDTSGQGGGGSCNANATALTLSSLSGQIIKFLINNDTVSCLIAQPLPVKIMSFDTRFMPPNTADIQWTVAMENEIDFYSIQRSINGMDWMEIGRYNPLNQNSETTHTYDFVDRALPVSQGNLYYRIVTSDYNGSVASTAVSSLKLGNEGAYASYVYPTNTNGDVYVQVADQNAYCYVMNMQGAVLKLPLDNNGTTKKIGMGYLPSGIYFLNVSSTYGREVFKILKY